ncbi:MULTISPECIES: mannose-1-phosphate guanylyltransferase/mannose-6-phosphate isomerase [unclassified Thioalkalivibrio]|uniref:mannose-1-phosphate guanylyltransferase/mannose-6-phosphate isomerase n=1 Tax=unclassified Thioalkalivibrio TaxID=2621013 RepID=UPI00037A36F7|nr:MULTISPECIES: mannose-1-phosphate guanylyltransferase/mannose-6-phosphate isomerase [unclassified Thioalkalivibrio]
MARPNIHDELQPVILAGGTGTRLWPVSRSHYPKQFLPLTGEQTLLQQTVTRLEGLHTASPLLLANVEHRFLAAEQLRAIGIEQARILLEPEGRNTAPAIALAALQARAEGRDPLLLVLAADHHIGDGDAFKAAVGRAVALAEAGYLVTFGIVPVTPETGYGYIQQGESLGEAGARVARFVEKPDAATAREYLSQGDYLWNSGMFVFRASQYLQELERFEPEIVTACQTALEGAREDLDFLRVEPESFARAPNISVDYAVMERTDRAAVTPLAAGWSDIGSWSALAGVRGTDAQGNTLRGDCLLEDSEGCVVDADGLLVAGIGLRNLAVVATRDAVLVADRDRVQDVKRIVERLKSDNRSEHVDHPAVYRPWGCYECVDVGRRYQVKRITVKPGAKLSLQMHHHRAEHWVVVSGTARVRNGEETYLVTENQSTYVPIGQIHSLENPGAIPLELIEIQSGSYLGEDDIVRLEDLYGRV